MVIAQRNVTMSWTGGLEQGSGEFSETNSSVLDSQAVTWASRTEAPENRTSPEELLAAAHSACFGMSVAGALGKKKHEPERLMVTATVTLDEVDGALTITASEISVVGRVPGMSSEEFASVIEEAEKGCPVSRLFSSATITVESLLEE